MAAEMVLSYFFMASAVSKDGRLGYWLSILKALLFVRSDSQMCTTMSFIAFTSNLHLETMSAFLYSSLPTGL